MPIITPDNTLPISLIVVAVLLFLGTLLAYNSFEGFRDWVDNLFNKGGGASL